MLPSVFDLKHPQFLCFLMFHTCMVLECCPLFSALFLELFFDFCCKSGMLSFSVLQNWNLPLPFYVVTLEQNSFLSTEKTGSRNFMAIKKQSGLALCYFYPEISNLWYHKEAH